jgi:hypothetical protein
VVAVVVAASAAVRVSERLVKPVDVIKSVIAISSLDSGDVVVAVVVTVSRVAAVESTGVNVAAVMRMPRIRLQAQGQVLLQVILL